MQGLGDCIMQRPFVRAAVNRARETGRIVYLRTPWPELYRDLQPTLQFVRSNSKLRTQARNEEAAAVRWVTPARNVDVAYFRYNASIVAQKHSYEACFESCLPMRGEPIVMDLPVLCDPPEIRHGGRPVAIVRPPTVRTEWYCPSRNPLPEYVNQIASWLMETHYVVALADIVPGREDLIGEEPPCHLRLFGGEWTTSQVIEAMRNADITVSAWGFPVHVAHAAGNRCITVLGGHGGAHRPGVLKPGIQPPNLGWIVPDNLCLCTQMVHDCDKRVSDLRGQWERAVQSTCAPVSSRRDGPQTQG